jgi:N-acetyl-1-D-myo-inositol-2-amino-2-deoxy-alpha-D-glucopyranoside deacetylase
MDQIKERTLLFIGAHPDDETFGIGGTIAHYTAEGVKVYYACATRGEAGIMDAEKMQGLSSPGDVRWKELECAGAVLGLAGIFHLGFRDSGMQGSEDNKHPEALTSAPLEKVAASIVKVIRQVKPQVVVTHDPIGGYRHPDHIATHKGAVQAFYSAGDPARYPEAGPAFQPQKLYFNLFPRGVLKITVKLMSLLGKDPHKIGRNKDIDIASIAEVDFPVNALVRLTEQDIETREKARDCHASQLGGRPPYSGLLSITNKIFGPRDSYMRYYPPVKGRKKENDLFQGLQ